MNRAIPGTARWRQKWLLAAHTLFRLRCALSAASAPSTAAAFSSSAGKSGRPRQSQLGDCLNQNTTCKSTPSHSRPTSVDSSPMSRSLSSHHSYPHSQDSNMTQSNESATNTASSPLAITLRNRVLSPPLGFNPPNSPPTLYTSAVAHFLSIPWCACLIQTPNTVPFVPQCFNPSSPSHDQLLGATLATPRGLQQVLSFFHTEDETHIQDPSRPIMHVSTLFALGEGLCGYEGVLHGGMIMTMADESMGILHDINNALGKNGSTFGSANVTAGLDIKFLKPGPINETVLVNAWVDSVEGRRTNIKCEIRDGRGIEIAKCSSTWVSVRPKI